MAAVYLFEFTRFTSLVHWLLRLAKFEVNVPPFAVVSLSVAT